MRYVGLDTVGHDYLRQAMPRAFGDVPEEERRRYGTVLEQVLPVHRRRDRPRDRAARAGRSAAGRLAVRHGAAQPAEAPARAGAGQPRERHARARARRVPDGVRVRRPPGPAPPRLRARRGADGALLLRPARSAATWTATRGRTCSRRAFTAARPLAFIPTLRSADTGMNAGRCVSRAVFAHIAETPVPQPAWPRHSHSCIILRLFNVARRGREEVNRARPDRPLTLAQRPRAYLHSCSGSHRTVRRPRCAVHSAADSRAPDAPSPPTRVEDSPCRW